MQRAILESPYAGEMRNNRIFAENVCRRLLLHNRVNCFASHLYYPYFLDELLEEERRLGIEAGLQWSQGVELVVFALSEQHFTPSRGMIYALERHLKEERRIVYGIFNPWSGESRHWLTSAQFFHPDGWVAGLRNDHSTGKTV